VNLLKQGCPVDEKARLPCFALFLLFGLFPLLLLWGFPLLSIRRQPQQFFLGATSRQSI